MVSKITQLAKLINYNSRMEICLPRDRSLMENKITTTLLPFPKMHLTLNTMYNLFYLHSFFKGISNPNITSQ